MTTRVLHIQKVAGIAGSESHLLSLLPRLPAHGYQPTMLVLADAHDRPAGFVERLQAAGVPVRVMPMAGDLDPWLPGRLARFMRREPYALVHTHLFHADFYGTWAAVWAGLPHRLSTHHGFAGGRDQARWLGAALRLYTYRQERLLTISEALRRWLHQFGGVPLEKMVTVHYGFEAPGPAAPALAPAGKIIGTVSRLRNWKRVDILIRAMPEILRQEPDAELWVIGDGPELEALQALSVALSVSERVKFLGHRTDVPALLRQCAVFAFASTKEGFGLVLLEAMAAGLPIVAPRAGSIPEIVADQETGLVVEPESPTATASALVTLLQDPARAAAMGAAGRRRLQTDFSVERMVSRTADIYRELLAGRGV